MNMVLGEGNCSHKNVSVIILSTNTVQYGELPAQEIVSEPKASLQDLSPDSATKLHSVSGSGLHKPLAKIC
jgi:hypothetical protein